MTKHSRNYIEELLTFYKRVDDADGVRYVERYAGAREEWIATMRQRNRDAATFFVRELASALIQVLVAVLLGR